MGATKTQTVIFLSYSVHIIPNRLQITGIKKMIPNKSVLSLVVGSLFAISAVATVQAREQIKIVGSSTVYLFSSSVAEEFGATTNYPIPVIESTGSGGGMKLFCKGNDLNTPDITNASRHMKAKEFKMCAENSARHLVPQDRFWNSMAQKSIRHEANFLGSSRPASATDLRTKDAPPGLPQMALRLFRIKF
jgi:hypothetical protein